MIIAFVPVRGGSKGIPHKNIKLFLGKPLVYWILNELELTKSIDKIILATECCNIKAIVESFNFKKVQIFDRSIANATDSSSTESVILEFLDYSEIDKGDTLLLAQATSPLTTAKNYTQSIELFKSGNYDSVLSCAKVKRFFWNENGKPINYDYKRRPRRQDFKGSLVENGAIYISKVENVLNYKNRISGKIGVYEMPEFTSIELDENEDWIIAESLMKKHILGNKKIKNIKLFVSDVDGVMTDAGMYYSDNGHESKKFNTRDGMGFQILREHGIKTAIVTSEYTNIVKNRAEKLKVDFLFQGEKHNGKLEVVKNICKSECISLENVAYIGDDINCFELLSSVGFAACPNDAQFKIKSIPGIKIMSRNGGEGVVREFISLLLDK